MSRQRGRGRRSSSRAHCGLPAPSTTFWPGSVATRPVTRRLAGAALVVALWVGLSPIVPVKGAKATPQQYAKALQYAIAKNLRQPGYTIRTVVVRPYHPLEIAKGIRIGQFQVWVAYAHRGRSHVMYFVVFPDGEVLDQQMVKTIGDTGGLLG